MFKKSFLSRTLREDIPIKSFDELVNLYHMQDRQIYIDTITPKVAIYVDSVIRFWNERDEETQTLMSEREPIKIYMNVTNGDQNAMYTLIDSIKMSRTPVYTINTGQVYKEALFVYLAGHKRFCYPNASFILQKLQPLSSAINENDNCDEFFEKRLSDLRSFVIEKTKLEENEYNKRIKGLWYIDAHEAWNWRICNEISNYVIQS